MGYGSPDFLSKRIQPQQKVLQDFVHMQQWILPIALPYQWNQWRIVIRPASLHRYAKCCISF